MHGWLILDKPLGVGSTDAVSAVKRALRAGGYPKLKVGHGGTLDPLATGVLPIALGEATKLAGRLLDSDKIYDFTLRFGAETATLDAEGPVVATSDVRPTAADVKAVLPRFTGPIAQTPPAYSALKVDGKRAYDLARAGETVTLASRNVTIHALTLFPLSRSETAREGVSQITLAAHVSKGTYIRSLARDIAHALGTVGHVTMLRRTRAGPFDLSAAITLDELAELGHGRALEHHLLPLRAGLDDIPALSLTPDQAGALRQGRVLAGIAAADGHCFAMLDETPVALVEVRTQEVRVIRGFNL
ncbi:MAG TPA: tRNA pseudouridine(55) synthase TruB [Sphingomonas sp.]|jgi:tRNA pseudouridine55 synthase|uniref:tRNA pseudouridine(55) synthase TruB n=1 Tax=Sphingomonas sp. TaxID=28214 RepID=UPI002ED8F7D2